MTIDLQDGPHAQPFPKQQGLQLLFQQVLDQLQGVLSRLIPDSHKRNSIERGSARVQ